MECDGKRDGSKSFPELASLAFRARSVSGRYPVSRTISRFAVR